MVAGSGAREPAGGQWFDNAVLVEPDAGVFASVLCEMNRERRRLDLMGREAALFAARHYSVEQLAHRYDRFYRRVLGNDPRTEDTIVVDRANDIATYR
jgi:hypothetical protein